MSEEPDGTEAPPAEEAAVPIEEREDIEVQAMKDRFVKLIRWVPRCGGCRPALARPCARTAPRVRGPTALLCLHRLRGRLGRCG